mmetsp:Transcript_140969/g.351512  ORF Transcript_140969/g.351512 Transcript_140969/m.351512 type:complete len:283 (-) Transcript_140969:154-1002(-)
MEATLDAIVGVASAPDALQPMLRLADGVAAGRLAAFRRQRRRRWRCRGNCRGCQLRHGCVLITSAPRIRSEGSRSQGILRVQRCAAARGRGAARTVADDVLGLLRAVHRGVADPHNAALLLSEAHRGPQLQQLRQWRWQADREFPCLHLDPRVDVPCEDPVRRRFEGCPVARVPWVDADVGGICLHADDVLPVPHCKRRHMEQVLEALAVLAHIRNDADELAAVGRGVAEAGAEAGAYAHPSVQESAVLADDLRPRVAREGLEAVGTTDERAIRKIGVAHRH